MRIFEQTKRISSSHSVPKKSKSDYNVPNNFLVLVAEGSDSF